MRFRTRFVYFKSCRYNLSIFARDLSILRVVDVMYAFSRDNYSYYYGDATIIYAFSIDTYPYFTGDVVIILSLIHI